MDIAVLESVEGPIGAELALLACLGEPSSLRRPRKTRLWNRLGLLPDLAMVVQVRQMSYSIGYVAVSVSLQTENKRRNSLKNS